MTVADIATTENAELLEDVAPEEPKLRHIINPPNNLHIWRPGMTAQDVVDIARVRRIEIVALCGVVFVPTMNPADVKETCDICMDIAGIMMNNPPGGEDEG